MNKDPYGYIAYPPSYVFDATYSRVLLSQPAVDFDMFKYLRGYDFSLDRMKKAK